MSSKNSPAKYCFVFDDLGVNSNIRTVPFSLANNKAIKFELVYRPNCNISTAEGTFTTIYLYLESSNKEQVSIEYRLSIGSGKNIKTLEGNEKFSIAKQMRYGTLFNIKQDYLLDRKNGFIIRSYKDGKRVEQLEICCEIKEIETKNDLNRAPQRDLFIENLQTLLETGKYADAVLIVGDKELRVHKNILAARSKVFGAMFEHDCKEKKQNRVEIIDIQLDVCEELLRYIYTAKIESMNKLAVELLVASDKYELNELKNECEEYLQSNLSIETVADILLMADLHQARQLKAKCIDFISDNGKKVKNTSGWKTLTTKADLTTDLFLKVTEKYDQLKNPLPEKELLLLEMKLSYFYNISREKLTNDFGALIESTKFGDTVFILKDGELKAHKNILNVRSKVFANIFEQEQDQIELPDVSVEVCKQLLRYIYADADYDPHTFRFTNGYTSILSDTNYANDLLMLSEKYQLDDLKTRSERILIQELKIESVSSILLLAEKYNASNLKAKCIEYITENCRQVTQTEEWKTLAKTKPELGIQLYEHIAAKQWS